MQRKLHDRSRPTLHKLSHRKRPCKMCGSRALAGSRSGRAGNRQPGLRLHSPRLTFPNSLLRVAPHPVNSASPTLFSAKSFAHDAKS